MKRGLKDLFQGEPTADSYNPYSMKRGLKEEIHKCPEKIEEFANLDEKRIERVDRTVERIERFTR